MSEGQSILANGGGSGDTGQVNNPPPGQSIAELSANGWVNTDGSFSDALPDPVKEILSRKQWKNINQVLHGYAELEKFTGKGKPISIPEGDDPAAWDKVFNALGRPETHDKYELKYEGKTEIDDALLGKFKQYAHSLGLTQKQFNNIVNFQLEAAAAQQDAWAQENKQITEQERNNRLAAIRQKYGADSGQKLKDALDTAKTLKIFDIIEAKGLGDDPEIIFMLNDLKSMMAEDTLTPADGAGLSEKDPAEEMEEIKISKAFVEKLHPDHKKTMKRFMELNQIIANRRLAQQAQSR